MDMNYKLQNSQIVQLAMSTAYQDCPCLDKDSSCTVQDLDLNYTDSAAHKRFDKYGTTDAEDWIVTDFLDHDGQDESGFYGCVVMAKDGKGKEHALLLFRGSNDNNFSFTYGIDQDMVTEWGGNNLGLFNQEGFGGKKITSQQKEAVEFTIKMMEKYPDLDFSMLGHSLGGQLALYVAIYIAENRPDLKYRINKAYNLDGPGYSDEFICNHKDAIDWLNKNDKMEHWQWSAVGDMEHSPIPESNPNHKIVAIENNGKLIGRHTEVPDLDENGDPKLTNKDFLAFLFGNGTRLLDEYGDLAIFCSLHLLGPIGSILGFVGITNWVWNKLGGWDGIKKKVGDAWNSFTSSCSNFFGGIVGYFKKKREKKLDGDYEVNLLVLGEVVEKYLSISGKIKTLADDSEIHILSGWDEIFKMQDSFLLKASARICIDSSRVCANSLKKASDSLNEVLRLYKQGDGEASDLYYAYKVASN